MGNESQVLQDVVQKTDSGIILFAVVVVVALIAFYIPLYTIIVKDRRERRVNEAQRAKDEIEASNARQDKYMERERGIIQVVTANTEVMASLKSTLERDGQANLASLERIHTRIDGAEKAIGGLSGQLVKAQMSIDEALRDNTCIKEDVKKTLLIVDAMPHGSNFHAGNNGA